jgi:hypothetical protein
MSRLSTSLATAGAIYLNPVARHDEREADAK